MLHKIDGQNISSEQYKIWTTMLLKLKCDMYFILKRKKLIYTLKVKYTSCTILLIYLRSFK